MIIFISKQSKKLFKLAKALDKSYRKIDTTKLTDEELEKLYKFNKTIENLEKIYKGFIKPLEKKEEKSEI